MRTAIARMNPSMDQWAVTAFDARTNAMQAMAPCDVFYAPYGGNTRDFAPQEPADFVAKFSGAELTGKASGSIETGTRSGTIR